MAAAIGASLLVATALTVALLSSLTSVGIGLGPFASATSVPTPITVEAPLPNLEGAHATPTTEIYGSDAPALLPQEQRCPCP